MPLRVVGKPMLSLAWFSVLAPDGDGPRDLRVFLVPHELMEHFGFIAIFD